MIICSDTIIAAKTIAMESRGEVLAGQLAVASVLKNRVSDGRWGDNYTSVCLWNEKIMGQEGQGFQFSGWRSQDPNFAYACGLRDNDPMVTHMLQILEQAESAPDTTNHALFYYSEKIAAPVWAPSMRQCGTFGTQIFLSDRPASGALTA